jgi:predicted lactoylglutathione lyase
VAGGRRAVRHFVDFAPGRSSQGRKGARSPALKGKPTMAIQMKMIFVNLPVKDLKRSVDFFTQLGFTFNPQFTDEKATCMIVGENIFVMLLVESFFKTFTPNPLCDATRHTEVIVALSAESREQVDELVRKAVAAGGKTPMPSQDHGFMYQHGFQDPDGHLWELVYMEPGAAG